MTIIVAVRDSKGVVIGCDTRTMYGWEPSTGKASKVTVRKVSGRRVYIGVCGDNRLADIVRYAPIPDDLAPERDEQEWIVMSLVPALRAASTAAGWTEKEKERETNSGAMLVVIGDRVFHLDNAWSAHEPTAQYWAIGSGNGFATGALHALTTYGGRGVDAMAVAERALNAACEHSASCGLPVKIERCLP